MNVGSLFTGVGGFDLGLERAGHRVLWQCEIDPFCRSVLARHWPGVERFGDIRSVSGGNGLRERNIAQQRRLQVPAVDLLCGGFPCQDLSVAGRRAGLAGERSSLFFEFARIADAVLGPGGWILIENVPGLLSSNGGRDFAVLLATLAELGFHDLAWRVLDSRYLGVPQRRRRVFILGRRASGDRARAVLLEPESGGGDFAPGREAGPRVAASLGSGSSGAGGHRIGAEEAAGNQLVPYTIHAAESCAQQRHAFETDQARALDSTGGFASNQGGTVIGTSPDPNGVRAAPGLPGRMDDPELREMTPGEDMGEAMRVFDPSGISPRLKKQSVLTLADSGQGTAHDPKPDGPRYAAMGNAVTVNVAYWIGLRLAALAGEDDADVDR